MPEPWWRAERGAWYAQVEGRQRCLGRGTKAEARQALVAILAGAEPAGDGPLVGEVCDLRRAWLGRERSPRTVKDADRFLAPFARALGRRPAAGLTAHDVLRWLDTRPGWGPQTRRHALSVVRAAFNHAVKTGLLEKNPIGHVPLPAVTPAPRVTGGADLARILPFVRSAEFRAFLAVLAETGCRPGELRRLTAADLVPGERAAVLVGKTTSRTGRKRVIWFTARAWREVRARAKKHPEGPLFRTDAGTEWSDNARNRQVRAIRARARKAKVEIPDFTSYSWRHGWITDGLEAGLSAEQLAAVAGNSAQVIERTYDHLRQRSAAMKAVVKRVRPGRG